LGPLRFPQAETHLRTGAELLAAHPSARPLWSAALARAAAIAADADIHLDFARVRFAGIDLPAGVRACAPSAGWGACTLSRGRCGVGAAHCGRARRH
jgi:hypothetical protein